eukprot:gnl/TRDRNA2_/TRDRNA2_160462_c0_seq2.p1 gnl/TRDRNA2_/TRDRNA2_160462_c0~~gnl/TRDRNA2_/TRDRNA2_160462_c0_seq2.p1  ORF type:complete len:208 (-),score=43.48 gnl/TRDRNA2_/TRDRNA2_160462_c0_seq2:51-674(-)
MAKYYGESEKRVAALCNLARDLMPAVLFFDEADSLFGRRTGSHTMEFHKSVTNSLLACLDGFQSNRATDRIFVMAATNMPEAIDEAALRRFGVAIEVPMPDAESRAHFFRQTLQRAREDDGIRVEEWSDVDLVELVNATTGYSFDDLTKLVSAALMYPVRRLGEDFLEKASAASVAAATVSDFRLALRDVQSTRQMAYDFALARMQR